MKFLGIGAGSFGAGCVREELEVLNGMLEGGGPMLTGWGIGMPIDRAVCAKA